MQSFSRGVVLNQTQNKGGTRFANFAVHPEPQSSLEGRLKQQTPTSPNIFDTIYFGEAEAERRPRHHTNGRATKAKKEDHTNGRVAKARKEDPVIGGGPQRVHAVSETAIYPDQSL